MEIKDLMRLMWRNGLYVILGLVLGAGMGIVVSKIQTPVYEATTKVFVSRTSQQGNSDMLLLDDEQLLAINLQLVKFPPVLDNVSSQLGSKIDEDNIQVGEIPNTLIISIKVHDEDPQRAATIANLLVQTLIQQNETLLSGRYTAFENAINEQIDQVQKQIDGLQTQINEINDTGIQEQLAQVNGQIEQLQTEISGLEQEIAGFPEHPTPLQLVTIAEKQAQLDQLHSLMTLYQQIQTNLTYIGKPADNGSSLENPRLTTLQSTLELYQQINITLINSREKARLARTQSRQNVMPIVSATPPTKPILPMPVPYFLLGGLVGLVLAATAILMIDQLNDSLKSAGQIEELLGLPVLGFVFENKHTKSRLVSSLDPLSTETDALRDLAASIELIAADKKVCTLLVTNIGPGESKTTIAANLAIINARQGKRVILLDGDLRHPHLHDLFGIENKMGVIDLLNDSIDLKGVIHFMDNAKLMAVIPSGITPKNSTRWPDADKLTRLFLKLQMQADLVIVDGPSAEIADTQMLASKVDAVLLLIESGHTHADPTQAALKRFQFAGARVIGAVLYSTLLSRLQNLKSRIKNLLLLLLV